MIDAQDPVDVYLDYLDTESAADNEENNMLRVSNRRQLFLLLLRIICGRITPQATRKYIRALSSIATDMF